MTFETLTNSTTLTVIDGGARAPRRAVPAAGLPRPVTHPAPRPEELARDMAQVYALSLLRDLPLADLLNPETVILRDGGSPVTLRMLLAQLSAFSRPHPHTGRAESEAGLNLSSASSQGHAGHRRFSRGGGQWTLFELLFGAGMALGPRAPLSAFLAAEGPQPDAVPETALPVPAPTAPMSAWIAWAEAETGAALHLPGRGPRAARPEDLSALSARVHLDDPRRAVLAAAILLLSQGVPLDAGLVAGGAGWSGPRLMSTLSRVAGRAARAARAGAATPRPDRPAVLATRLALAAAGEDLCGGAEAQTARALHAQLQARVPELLDWVARANAARPEAGHDLPDPEGGALTGWMPLALRHDLSLPTPRHNGSALPLAVAEGSIAVAAAMATVAKAVLALRCPGGTQADERGVGAELDALVANLASGRCAAGGAYPSEMTREIVLGEAVALDLLRDTLEADGAAAGCTLRSFEGHRLAMQATPCGPGAARVTLCVDGAVRLWPERAHKDAQDICAVV